MPQKLLIMLCLALAAPEAGHAEVPTLPRVAGVLMQALATRSATGVYEYRYRLRSDAAAPLAVSVVRLDLRNDASRQELPSTGLSNGSGVMPSTQEDIAALGPGGVVPVGFPATPRFFIAGVDVRGWALWTAGERPLAPGATAEGFVLSSPGLPGIRDAALEADLWDHLPNVDDPNVDTDADETAEGIEASALRVKTIGPVAPPKTLDLVVFADYLSSLRNEAAALGWVRSSAGVSGVDSLIGQMRGQLATGAFGPARITATALIAAVESASCAELDCPLDRPMTAEARGLLSLNTAFLRDHIPAPAALETAPAHLWLGLENSDDQGTQFDIRVELFANGTLVSEGTALCVTGITRNAANAKDVAVAFAPSTGLPASGDAILFKVSTRIGTNPDGSKCPGHNNAVGLRLYYDGSSRSSHFGAALGGDEAISYFLHLTGTASTLSAAAPTASSAKQKDSAGLNFAGGNAWVEIGSWSMTAP